MKPIEPVIKNVPVVIYAKDQPEYLPLPVIKCDDGTLISRWRLSLFERLCVLFKGDVFLVVSTFNAPLQPVLLQTFPPVVIQE